MCRRCLCLRCWRATRTWSAATCWTLTPSWGMSARRSCLPKWACTKLLLRLHILLHVTICRVACLILCHILLVHRERLHSLPKAVKLMHLLRQRGMCLLNLVACKFAAGGNICIPVERGIVARHLCWSAALHLISVQRLDLMSCPFSMCASLLRLQLILLLRRTRRNLFVRGTGIVRLFGERRWHCKEKRCVHHRCMACIWHHMFMVIDLPNVLSAS